MDSQWKYSADFSVRGHEVDAQDRLTVPSLCSYMEEAAGRHASHLSYAVEKLLAHGKTWVLVRMYLESYAPAVRGGRVTVRTWPVRAGKLLFRRDFEIVHAGGAPCAKATSLWAVVDTGSRRAEKISQEMAGDLSPDGAEEALKEPLWKIPSQENSPVIANFRARFADIDRNRHLNNVRYVEWFIESAPYLFKDDIRLGSIEIMYRAEAFYRDHVVVRGSVGGEEGEFWHGMYHSGGKELACARTRWIPSR